MLPWPALQMRIDAVDDLRQRRSYGDERYDGDLRIDEWQRRIERYRNEPRAKQADIINQLINQQIVYLDDLSAYGLPDYWALWAETLATRTGDCEDIALAKLESLAYLGWSEADLAIAVGDLDYQGEQVAHAVAAVRIDDSGDPMVLGNVDPATQRLSARDDFAPVYVATIERDGPKWLFLRNLMRRQEPN